MQVVKYVFQPHGDEPVSYTHLASNGKWFGGTFKIKRQQICSELDRKRIPGCKRKFVKRAIGCL